MTRFKRALLASLIAVCLTGLFLFLQASFAAQIELNPIAFSLGKFEVRWYGLLIGLSILIGFPWAVKRATQQNILPDRAESVLWWSIVGGAVGARFLYVVQNFAFYQLHSQQILEVFDGGLSIHGMIAGGLIAGYLAAKFYEVRFWDLADAATAPMLLGMVIGRFGNFANYELFGYPTEVAWKMFVPSDFRPVAYVDEEFFHPVFLYDAILNLGLLFLLLRFKTKFRGELLLRFLVGIALTRFVVEFLRIGEIVAFGLTSAQLASVMILIVGLILILLGRKGRIHFD
ncbi:prolipoprotein diacylglyceryl transferase [Candidatus Berkelbacteria bacterium]|nr:prolipoprotein diacylglyceryl transferase [Candidatus Berkelbacteria bacterium]